MRLDELPTLEVLRLLNEHDGVAVSAVREALPGVARLVDLTAERFRSGGNVHYFGAGTSGRLGVLDAAELVPTFNLDPQRVVAHIAGGHGALLRAIEGAEDSREEGAREARSLGSLDVAIGLAASGNTPYVAGALEMARSNGAHTALVSSNPDASIAALVHEHILLDTGPEVLTGSTRLKAATAEKLVLNGFSTALAVAVGQTWSNLMVSLVATNEKLRLRTLRILSDVTGLGGADGEALLQEAGGELKTAIVAHLAAIPVPVARDLLHAAQGSVRAALEQVDEQHKDL